MLFAAEVLAVVATDSSPGCGVSGAAVVVDLALRHAFALASFLRQNLFNSLNLLPLVVIYIRVVLRRHVHIIPCSLSHS